MAAPLGFDESDSSSRQVVEQGNKQPEEKRVEEAIKKMYQREDPVNILVIGPTGAGKSTLINSLLGDAVARAGHGARSVQFEVTVHVGEYKGIQLRVYDTVGFSDTRGKSDDDIVKEIAQASKFDLILICIRMTDRIDQGVQDMFKSLGDMINREMWDRTVIVLTFANMYVKLRSIRKSLDNKEQIVRYEIENIKRYMHKFLSTTLEKEAIDEIPFCIAGDEDERKLPTTDDWLKELWKQCLKRCSEDARGLLTAIAKYRIILMEAGPIYGGTLGAVVGGAIGGVVGTILPGTGNIIGATGGAMIGGGIGGTISGVALAVKRKKKEQPPDTEQKN